MHHQNWLQRFIHFLESETCHQCCVGPASNGPPKVTENLQTMIFETVGEIIKTGKTG